MPTTTASSIGDADDVELHVMATTDFPHSYYNTIHVYEGATKKVWPVPWHLPLNQEITVGFDAHLKYKYDSYPTPIDQLAKISKKIPAVWLAKRVKTTEIHVEIARWRLTRTSTGIEVDAFRLGASDYESNFIKFDATATANSSTVSKNGWIGIQISLMPVDGSSGGFSVQLGPLGATQSASNTSRLVRTAMLVLEFQDLRPAPPPPPPVPKPVPITVPQDMLATMIGPYKLNQHELRSPARDKLDTWLRQLQTRNDCKELLAAITRTKKSDTTIIRLIGAADGTGNADINNPLSEARARHVRDAILDKLGRGDGGAERSISWKGTGAERLKPTPRDLPKVPNSDERYVRIEIDQKAVEAQIQEMRATGAVK